MTKKLEKVTVSEHVIEVRHEASGRFLDSRGFIADHIKASELFPHWQIETNVVNFTDIPKKAERSGAFVGYRSAGIFIYDPDTRNYFEEKANKFWRTLNNNQFYVLPELTRFGCRTKIFINSEKTFQEINSLLFSKFMTTEFSKMVGEREKDFQLVVDFEIDKFTLRFICGPINKEEASRYFSFESDHFSDTGVFLDLDVYVTKDLRNKDIPALTKKSMEITWKKIDNFLDQVDI